MQRDGRMIKKYWMDGGLSNARLLCHEEISNLGTIGYIRITGVRVRIDIRNIGDMWSF